MPTDLETELLDSAHAVSKALRHAAHAYHGVTASRRISGDVATLAQLPPARGVEDGTAVRVVAEDRCYVTSQGKWVLDAKAEEAAHRLYRAALAYAAVRLVKDSAT